MSKLCLYLGQLQSDVVCVATSFCTLQPVLQVARCTSAITSVIYSSQLFICQPVQTMRLPLGHLRVYFLVPFLGERNCPFALK